MKVHLIDKQRTSENWTVGWCYLGHFNVKPRYKYTVNQDEATCKTCLRAHAAWQRRKEVSK